MQYRVLFASIFILLLSCTEDKEIQTYNADSELEQAVMKMKMHIKSIPLDSANIPRAIDKDGSLITGNSRQWTSGFFPGTLWQLYDHSRDGEILQAAKAWTEYIEKEKWDTHTHDLGFKLNSCFGKAYKITNNSEYKEIIIEASKTLIKRYDSNIGAIRSWDWNADVWQYPVIIDNMMNLEMLFDAFDFTGDSLFYEVAYQHALTTLNNHFREDHSAFHVLDFDTTTYDVRLKTTHQGYSDGSAWARGQAWALHGFTRSFIRTKDSLFLNQAIASADYMFTHKNLHEDFIPYWDYDAPNIPNEPRDVSAATVAASALLDLAKIVPNHKKQYLEWVDKILGTLSTDTYKSLVAPFLLDHSTGSVPGDFEVDVPIVYADFYYVEALLKRKDFPS